MPTKRLVVLYDGTDNTTDDRTNVWRTCELLAERDAFGVPQLKKYIPGVGTEFGQIALGSIFGDGVSRKIREGYAWLVDNYEPDSEIYVFGFSRGAFTARSLVQVIACCGLARKNAKARFTPEQAFSRYEAVSREEAHPIWKLRYWQHHPEERPASVALTLDDALMCDDSVVQVVKVRLAGLWDTVGAIGTDAMANHGALTQKSAEHNVRPTKSQEYGYHAIAIDEHRPMFDVTLWRVFVPDAELQATAARYAPYYEQRWFIGAHSDVGGGYGDDRLPNISLAWMLAKASALGLAFTGGVTPAVDGWKAPVHDSFRSFAGGILNLWAKLMPGDQKVYREIVRTPRPVATAGGLPGRLVSINETIDPSVFERWRSDPTYRPKSLEEYFTRNPSARPS